jgi:hypothetical protein
VHIRIVISKDSPGTLGSVYRADCSECGAVDKGFENQIKNRANEHNRRVHSSKGQVINTEA